MYEEGTCKVSGRWVIFSAFNAGFCLCPKSVIVTTLKRETKIAADVIFIFYFYLSEKIRLEFTCEQRIHLKHQVLFSLKNNEKHLLCRLLQS